ncbi:hypothetical protein CYMTET_4447 [Cymbomonas tetramitiformis]|uniref:Cellulase n=1 Tax=Cymbomonas tetramitiformis TaxID=36881 RepID=A0AAE0H166_9CHLO|nr:hypothetical protein CYMTET_4447 [Cymbomonas tetramitiformis]
MAPVAFFFALVALADSVNGHGYLTIPRSRNAVANEDGEWWCPDGYCESCSATEGLCPRPEDCPHCLNRAGGADGLCGIVDDRNYMHPENMNGAPILVPPLQATYAKGALVEVDFVIHAHHKGHVELHLCPESMTTNQECFDAHPLTFVADLLCDEPAQPDPSFPERGYLCPYNGQTQNGGPITGMPYRHVYRLPEGVQCERCLLQWYYLTANSCAPPGYRNYAFPQATWFQTSLPDCGIIPEDGVGGPEQFWNCADVSISNNELTPSPSLTPAPPSASHPPQASSPPSVQQPSPSPVPAPPPLPGTSPGCCSWNNCGECGDTAGWCGASRTRCEDSCSGQWCGAAAPAPTPTPTPTPTPSMTCEDLEGNPDPVDSSGFALAHGKLSLGGERGIQLVDQFGEPLQLMGMSSHGVHWFPECYTFQSLEHLVKHWGITVFRAAMYIGEGGYSQNRGHRDLVMDIVDWCEELGIYVVIDWHVLTPGDPNYWLDGAGAESGTSALEFWEEMAEEHRGKSHVLYEIANEPNGVGWGSVKAFSDTIIAAIRAIDPETVILVGTTTWSQDIHLAAAQPVASPYNVMYTFHFYAGTHADLMARVREVSGQIPVFVSEWGTSEASGNNGPFLDTAREFLELFAERRISWAQWSYADKAETSAALSPGACAARLWNATSCSGAFVRSYIKNAMSLSPSPASPSPPSSPSPPPSIPGTSPPPPSPPPSPSLPPSIPGTSPPPCANSVMPDPEMSSNATWTFWAHRTLAGANATWGAYGESGAPAVRVAIQNGGTKRWHVKLAQKDVLLQPDEEYLVQVKVKANRGVNIQLRMLSDCGTIVSESTLDVTSTWRVITSEFHVDVRVNAKLMILFGRSSMAGAIVDIDTVDVAGTCSSPTTKNVNVGHRKLLS